MNDDTFEALSPKLQSVVEKGFLALQEVTIRVPKERRAAAIEQFEAAGGKIYWPTHEEKAEFVKAAQPVYGWYIRQFGNVWLEKVDAAITAQENRRDE